MEHRWGQRVPVTIKVRLACRSGAIGSGWLHNVSISGGFVQTDASLPLLARIQIEARLTLWGTEKIHEISASVVRRNPNGIGVEWSELAPAPIAALLESAPRAYPQPSAGRRPTSHRAT